MLKYNSIAMVNAVVFDFCRVFLFPRDENYFGELNALHKVLSESPRYNFNDNFVFNNELMEFIRNCCMDIRYGLYIFTSGTIQETPECQNFLDGTFREIISATEEKLPKNKMSSYLILADKIGTEPDGVLFIDDSRKNTVAAEQAGMQTITFRNNMQFEAEIGGYVHMVV